jgi:hypothetical protein
MTKMARTGRGRLDLKGDGQMAVVMTVTAVGKERREEDRGVRRRDLRGRPLVGKKVVREGSWGSREGVSRTDLEKVLAVRAQRTCVVSRHKMGLCRTVPRRGMR